MNRWPIAICLLAVGSPAAAQEARVSGFRIVEAGLYSRDIVSSQRGANGVVQNAVSNPQLTTGTTRIPARLGVSFGIRYIITGVPDRGSVTVRTETRYPPPGARPPGSVSPLAFNLVSSRAKLSSVRFAGYTLAEPWELMPGKWVISIWVDDRKLGEKEFTLVRQ
jgi:hypothetical protein